MGSYLPSKKFAIITLSIVFGLVVVFFITNAIGGKGVIFKQKQKSSLGALGSDLILKDLIEKDTDGDGLSDWEEALWGTSPTNPDTNNDGVSDDIEVAQKRKLLGERVTQNESGEQLNTTEKFAREFFASVVALKQSDNLTSETLNALALSFTDSVTAGEIPDVYTSKDISLVQNTETSNQHYQDQIKNFFLEHLDTPLGTELEIIANSLSSNNPVLLEELGQIAEEYYTLALELGELEVPEQHIQNHLMFMNNTTKLAIVVKNIGFIFDDPLIGLQAFALYQKYSDEFIISLENIASS